MESTHIERPFTFVDSESGGLEGLGSIRPPGRISFFPYLDTSNIYKELEATPDQLPHQMRELRSQVDFHRATLKVNVESAERVRGVHDLAILVRIVGEGEDPHRVAVIDSVGPESEWKDRPYSANGTIELSYGLVGDFLKLVGVNAALPIPAGKVAFAYRWNPKIGTVKSGSGGVEASWQLSRSDSAYLDGDHELLLVIRRPRGVKRLTLDVYEAKAVFDLGYWRRDAIINGKVEIPVNFTESAPV